VTESVEDDFAYVGVEVQFREEVVLLVDEVHVTVSNHHQLFRSGIGLLDGLNFSVVKIANHALELLGSGLRNELFQKDLVLLLEIVETLL
jgi:hypothetical protein